jgi:hypothetical protein
MSSSYVPHPSRACEQSQLAPLIDAIRTTGHHQYSEVIPNTEVPKGLFVGFSFVAPGQPALPPSKAIIQYQLRLQLLLRQKSRIMRERQRNKESRYEGEIVCFSRRAADHGYNVALTCVARHKECRSDYR